MHWRIWIVREAAGGFGQPLVRKSIPFSSSMLTGVMNKAGDSSCAMATFRAGRPPPA